MQRLALVPLLCSLGCSLTPPATAQRVTTPAEHLGRPVGRDFELADWAEVSGYFRRLGVESPRVLVDVVGETTEGRDFLLAVVSSAENLARLDEIRAATRRIADPRGLAEDERERLLDEATPVVFVSIAMHSTETAAPQFGMELAHRLATSDEEPYRSARETAVVLIAPCLNPDGLDHVVSWYREHVGTPYESSGLLKLYQYYAGHDNNRDWFMVSQNETRIVTGLLYSEWFPQIYWDVHQQGGSRERMFVPPFRDPLNPNLDPGIIAGIGQIGARALFDMTREGFTGISTGVTYDMWWNGGNRNVPVRHNVVGLLTEAASVRIASPVWMPKSDLSGPRGLGDYGPSNRFPAPWPGGWWRLRDIIDYEHGFARSLLASVTREPRTWLANALEAAERAIGRGAQDSPRAWIVPSDNRDRGAVRRLADALLVSGVELGVADEPIEADGRTWPAGSIVIDREQPYGQHVKDLFEVQEYPEGDPPYDVAGWTLPLLLGIRRVEVEDALGAPARLVSSATEAVAGFPAGPAPPRVDLRDSDGWRALFARLAEGGGFTLEPVGEDERLVASLGDDAPDGFRARRIGVYAPWTGSMDEGWLRYALDSFGVPYVRVRNEMIRAGELEELVDVLVFASVSGRLIEDGREPGTVPPRYTGGIGAEGAAAVADFVGRGGQVIAIGASADWAIDLFELPVTDATRGDEAGEFSCPGSVLRGVPAREPATASDAAERMTRDLPRSVPLFFSRSAAWAVDDEREDEVDVLLRYAPNRVLLSGWIRDEQVIADRAAWVRAPHGDGVVHLFAFRPQYRGWSQGTFHLLFRALALEE